MSNVSSFFGWLLSLLIAFGEPEHCRNVSSLFGWLL
jgi:hypothetical protein